MQRGASVDPWARRRRVAGTRARKFAKCFVVVAAAALLLLLCLVLVVEWSSNFKAVPSSYAQHFLCIRLLRTALTTTTGETPCLSLNHGHLIPSKYTTADMSY